MKKNKSIYVLLLIFIIFFLGFSFYFFSKKDEKPICAKVIFPNKNVINCELAITPSQQILGLMFRRQLKEGSGMLFIFNEEEKRTFWMKNTYIPLDIIFISANKKINRIFHGVEPYNEKMKDFEIPRVSSYAKYVLEVSSGTAIKNNLKEGDRIKISLIQDERKCN